MSNLNDWTTEARKAYADWVRTDGVFMNEEAVAYIANRLHSKFHVESSGGAGADASGPKLGTIGQNADEHSILPPKEESRNKLPGGQPGVDSQDGAAPPEPKEEYNHVAQLEKAVDTWANLCHKYDDLFAEIEKLVTAARLERKEGK